MPERLTSDKFTLVGQTPVPCEDLLEWGRWLETAECRVGFAIVGPYEVSTRFMGLELNLMRALTGHGEPLLFETMIFSTALRVLHTSTRVDFTVLMSDEFQARDKALRDTFDAELLDYQERYGTWPEAEAGHARAVALAVEKTGVAAQVPDAVTS